MIRAARAGRGAAAGARDGLAAVSRIAGVLAVLLAVALAADVARGEHQVFYRYTILGYVKDGRGRPVRAREVKVIREKTGFSYLGETDASGLYVVIVRLGDESAGEHLTVQTGRATARVTVRFDPANHTDERGTRLDVEGARVTERAAWFAPTLSMFLGQPGR